MERALQIIAVAVIAYIGGALAEGVFIIGWYVIQVFRRDEKEG